MDDAASSKRSFQHETWFGASICVVKFCVSGAFFHLQLTFKCSSSSNALVEAPNDDSAVSNLAPQNRHNLSFCSWPLLALWPFALALWPWPFGPLALWPFGPLAIWPFGPLALCPLALWPFGPLALWPFGLSPFRFGLLALWLFSPFGSFCPFGPLAVHFAVALVALWS